MACCYNREAIDFTLGVEEIARKLHIEASDLQVEEEVARALEEREARPPEEYEQRMGSVWLTENRNKTEAVSAGIFERHAKC